MCHVPESDQSDQCRSKSSATTKQKPESCDPSKKRKRSETEESQPQEPKISRSGIVGSRLAQLVCTMYQIAGCDADHVGEWTGLWEDCILLSSADTQFIDVQILTDGVVCKQVPRKFLRLKKTTFSLVDRQWL